MAKIKTVVMEVEQVPILVNDPRWKSFCLALFMAMEADGLLTGHPVGECPEVFWTGDLPVI